MKIILSVLFFPLFLICSMPVSMPFVGFNQAYKGTIIKAKEEHWYKFTGFPNKRYYVVVWADNTFGNSPGGLRDTQIYSYFYQSNNKLTVMANTDGPTWANLGYGSMVVLEGVPSSVQTFKKSHFVGPSDIRIKISQQDIPPEVGTYTFKIFVDDIPKKADGTYYYECGSSTYLFTSAINPPGEDEIIPAPKTSTQPPAISTPKLVLKSVNGKIVISWNIVPFATGYNLFFAPYPNADTIYSLDMGTKTNTVFGVHKGSVSLYVGIIATSSFGESKPSNLEFFKLP